MNTERMLAPIRSIPSGGRISNRIRRMSSVVVVDDIYPMVRTGDIHRFGIVAVVYLLPLFLLCFIRYLDRKSLESFGENMANV